MPTDFAALDALYPLNPQELPRQWVLTRDEALIPVEWERRTLNGWHLGVHPLAVLCDLSASDGTPLGWAIEFLAYLGDAGDIVPAKRLTLPVGAQATPAEIERALYGRDEQGRSSGDGLIGTWTAVVFGGPEEAPFRRVYLGATHAVVYSPQSRTVATTHNLVPGLCRDEALSRAFDPLVTKSYFTFGLTAFEGLRRLLPNHYLDLDTFRPVRHWPLNTLEPLAKGEDGAAAIVEHSRRLIDVLSTTHDSFLVFLSAGRDSRAILALLRPFVAKGADVLLSTTVTGDLESRTDLQAARRLVCIAGLPHEVKRRRPRSGEAPDVRRVFARIGESMYGPILAAAARPPKRTPVNSRFKLAGMAGETGRAHFWGPHSPWGPHPPTEKVTPKVVARLTKSPPTDAVIGAAEAWLKELPPKLRASGPSTLDLAYVEQRMGCWQAPGVYLFPNPRHVSSPMAETFNIETMLRLPEAYRAAGRLQQDMVAYGWPELLEVPFNKPAGLLRPLGLLRDARRHAGRARFHLRRLFRRFFPR